MKTQNLSNHRRFVPFYHFVVILGILVLVSGSIRYAIMSSEDNLYSATLLVLTSVLLLFVALFARSFALKAQDRAICAEEKFRYYLLTKNQLPEELTVRQIVGLRFASDKEFPELADQAAKDNLSENEIKKAIKNWKGDYYRV